jgi:hypothetical protein
MANVKNAHTQLQREFIVRRLAGFVPPRAIVAEFVAVFSDTGCNENDILATDPETTLLAPDLHALFLKERERVLLDPKSAPYADRAARLIALSNHARFYASNNQFPEMRTVLRHIAEETGDIVNGKPGGKASVGKPEDNLPPIVAITRTIVDPAAPVPAE